MSIENQELSPNEKVWAEIKDNYHYYDTPLIHFISSFIEKNCQSVFEAAVGSGSLPNTLRQNNYQGDYLGSDYVDKFLEMAQKNLPDEKFIKQDLREPINLEDKSVDCSVVIDGLDYVYPYKPVLKELKRVSRKYIIIALWQEFLPENKIRFTEEWNWGVNTYAKDEWYKTLEELDLKIIVDANVKDWNADMGRLITHNLFILQT